MSNQVIGSPYCQGCDRVSCQGSPRFYLEFCAFEEISQSLTICASNREDIIGSVLLLLICQREAVQVSEGCVQNTDLFQKHLKVVSSAAYHTSFCE